MIPTLIAALQADPDMTAGFGTIAHALGLDPVDIEESETTLPACYVFSPKEDMSPDDTDGPIVSQMIKRYISIFCVCDYSVLDARKAEIRAVAHGWRFNGDHTLAELVEGELIQIRGDIVWWLDTYVTEVQLRQNPN